MATAAQIEANRRNAQKSTGPKTDQGKACARLCKMREAEFGMGRGTWRMANARWQMTDDKKRRTKPIWN
jgi:hypothetical protein